MVSHNMLNLKFRAGQSVFSDVICADGEKPAVYAADVYCLCAGLRVLKYNISKGANTIRRLMERWVPASSHDAAAYVEVVATGAGVSPDTRLAFSDALRMCHIIRSIAKKESGVEVSDRLLATAYAMVK